MMDWYERYWAKENSLDREGEEFEYLGHFPTKEAKVFSDGRKRTDIFISERIVH